MHSLRSKLLHYVFLFAQALPDPYVSTSFTLRDRLLHAVLTKLFKYHDIIKPTGDVPTLYLRRYFVFRTKTFPNHRIFLHFINRSDDDGHLHDHPWKFTSLILSNGYVEAIRGRQSRELYAGSVVHNPAEHTHKVALHGEKPTWTLVSAWKAHREWGFWVDDQWVMWRTYLGLDAEAQPDSLEDV